MSYTVGLPDGRTVEFPDDVPKDKAAEIIKAQLGPRQTPIGGIAGALGMGVEAPISSVRTGLESLLGGNAAVEAGLGRTGDVGDAVFE